MSQHTYIASISSSFEAVSQHFCNLILMTNPSPRLFVPPCRVHLARVMNALTEIQFRAWNAQHAPSTSHRSTNSHVRLEIDI